MLHAVAFGLVVRVSSNIVCPLFASGGLVNELERDRRRIPPLFDLLHLVQAPHFEYPPWTRKERHLYGKRKQLAHESKSFHSFYIVYLASSKVYLGIHAYSLFHKDKEPTAYMKTCIALTSFTYIVPFLWDFKYCGNISYQLNKHLHLKVA